MSSFRPGHIDIQELLLLPPSGNNIDLTGLFLEMSVFENIFANSLSGTITIADTHNLISVVPLLGEEYLSFKYKVLDTDEVMHAMFRTYKISDREIEGNKQLYKIHFTTMEMYQDATHGLSRTLSGTAEVIISTLLSQELKTGKTFTFDPSGNHLKLTSPWWSPFKCIGWTSQKAVSSDQYRTSDYLFYETFAGYKFRNISLAKTAAPKAHFQHNHDRAVSDDFSKQTGKTMGLVLDFYTPLVVDQLDRFRHGVYKTQTYAHDITFKALNIHEYNLFDNWETRNHLNKFAHFTSQLEPFVSAAISVAHEATYSYNDKEYDWQGVVTSQRKPSVMLNEMIKIDIEVWGRMGLEPGDVVTFTTGKMTQADTSSLDEYYSGKYMISAIHHRFAKNEYKMYLQLIKDSVSVTLN